MRLEKVTGPPFGVTCCKCQKRTESDRDVYADLDGEPFKAYYCSGCVGKPGRNGRAS